MTLKENAEWDEWLEEDAKFALRKFDTLEEQLAYMIDATAALGTPEMVYRVRPGETLQTASARELARVRDIAEKVAVFVRYREASCAIHKEEDTT